MPRDADELHDLLLGLVVAPLGVDAGGWLPELARAGRAAVVETAAVPLAFAAESALAVQAIYPGCPAAPSVSAPARAGAAPSTREGALVQLVRGHAETLGPFTAASLGASLGIAEGDVAAAAAQLEVDGVLLRGRFTPGRAEEELCDRRLLARIHRYTLDRLRSEIDPVSAQDFLRYLFERHHLTERARAGGKAGLRAAIEALQGFEAGAAAWERHVLAPRVAGYRPEWLDDICLAGEIAWGRLSPKRSSPLSPASSGSTSRATPIALALRRDIGWLLEAVRGPLEPESPPAAGPAGEVLQQLRRRGALFFDDLVAATGLPALQVGEGLWDLVGRGIVASDGWQPLRDLMGSAKGRGRRSAGRWSVIERPAAPTDDLADRVAGQLLARYGVVFRELTSRESFEVPWRDVVRALRRREARGLVRGGRFVAGYIGEQYGLPEAVDDLRRVRRRERNGELVRIRACDPLNLVGILAPGRRIPATQGAWLVFRDGALLDDLDDAIEPAAASIQPHLGQSPFRASAARGMTAT
jgi:ATP-dependent Lhr-like helicase